MGKDGSQNHTVIVGKGSIMQKMLENPINCGTWNNSHSPTLPAKEGMHFRLVINIMWSSIPLYSVFLNFVHVLCYRLCPKRHPKPWRLSKICDNVMTITMIWLSAVQLTSMWHCNFTTLQDHLKLDIWDMTIVLHYNLIWQWVCIFFFHISLLFLHIRYLFCDFHH